MIDFVSNNKEWLFSGIGVFAITATASFAYKSVVKRIKEKALKALIMVKIRKINDSWLKTVVENKNKKIVYEYFRSPDQKYEPKARDFICVYDSLYNVKLWGIINEFKYCSEEELVLLSNQGWNIGFTREQLDNFTKKREEKLGIKSKNKEIPVIKFKIKYRYIETKRYDEFVRKNSIKIDKSKLKDIAVCKIYKYKLNFIKDKFLP